MNLMLDLETLGTRPGCVILAIAAVPLDSPHIIEPFYVKIDKKSAIAEGFHVDEATVAWWSKQSKEAQDEAFSGTIDIRSALHAFSEYCNHLPKAPIIWGNGADFDNAILAETFRKVGMTVPWKYTDSRCYRTLKTMYPHIPFKKPTIPHHALYDAGAQATHLKQIFDWIRGRM